MFSNGYKNSLYIWAKLEIYFNTMIGIERFFQKNFFIKVKIKRKLKATICLIFIDGFKNISFVIIWKFFKS